jgi:hypothetical protein
MPLEQPVTSTGEVGGIVGVTRSSCPYAGQTAPATTHPGHVIGAK